MCAFACPPAGSSAALRTACLNCGPELGFRWPEQELGASRAALRQFRDGRLQLAGDEPGALCSGRDDLYPFVLAPAVVEKLRLVDELIREAR